MLIILERVAQGMIDTLEQKEALVSKTSTNTFLGGFFGLKISDLASVAFLLPFE